MPDPFTQEQRSALMARVKNRNTTPELQVRRLLHRMGYRFRLHRKDLPGHPDITLPRYKMVIFVHGCFWHGHEGCPRAARPATRVEFWNAKIDKNIARDIQVQQELKARGWHVHIVWQCRLRNLAALETELATLLPRDPKRDQ
jgi:DNA mismatch endonuclease (patch repair protein)